MERDNTKWYAMSDQDLIGVIGNFIRDARLSRNMTQSQLSRDAGINRSTLSQVENGVGGTLFTLIRLLRSLEKLELFEQFTDRQSPLKLARQEQSGRQRASKREIDRDSSDW